MKILMTSDTVGGVWSYAVDLADALASRGVETHLATMGRLPDDAQRASVERLHTSAYRLEWEDDPWEDVDRAGAWLLDLADDLKPDLVHLNGFAHGCLRWPAPVVVAAHSDVVSWWWAVHGEEPPERYNPYRSAVEGGLRAADAVVAPTRSALRDLRLHYRFDRPRFVVPNSRAVGPYEGAKEPFVLGLGRFWDEAKNIGALERARAGSPWPIVIAGDGTPLGKLDASGVASLLERAAIFASPAHYEPFGLAILEAAVAGCALVLADLPSLREVWGDAALFAQAGDDGAFVSALLRVERDGALRRDLARRAQRRARRFSPERTRDGYLAVYEQVLAT
jgi:glycogen(starch) synthase